MAEQIVDLTCGLYQFMQAAEQLLAGPTRGETRSRLAQHAHSLSERFSASRKRAGEKIAETYEEISENLRAFVSELGCREDLRARWKVLGVHYEALVAHIRQVRLHIPRGIRLGHLKPNNYPRNLFHVGMGLVGILLYEFVLSRTLTLAIGGTMLGIFFLLEILRRVSDQWNERLLWVFGKLGRPHEVNKVCTSTWYLSGLVVGVWLLPKYAIELGTLVLAFADPVAALVGKRWGQRKLLADKSYAGTAAFFLTATIMCTLFIWWLIPAISTARAVGLAAAIAAVGATTELVSTRINDNLSIPLVAGFAAMLLI